jgi:hypothetical protein
MYVEIARGKQYFAKIVWSSHDNIYPKRIRKKLILLWFLCVKNVLHFSRAYHNHAPLIHIVSIRLASTSNKTFVMSICS